jgi:ankyrin repeat protein
MFKKKNIVIALFLYCASLFQIVHAANNIPALVKKIQSSVVVINMYDENGEELGLGSGFFISEKGEIITNRHVLMGASKAEVKTFEGKTYQVKNIIAEDKESDLLRFSLENPETVNYNLTVSTITPKAGEKVIVISSPMGLEQTVSDGIVSAVRDIPDYGNIIQITAPISPGSSGSPVVNMKGQVIGVATFLVTEGQNLNFAVPGERIKNLNINEEKTLVSWNEEIKEEWLTTLRDYYSEEDVAPEKEEKTLAIIQAVKDNDLKKAKFLIKTGADVNAKDEDGGTALMWTAQKGYTEIVKALFEAGANINAKKNDGATALMAAAFVGHTEIVKALIEAGADVNVKSKSGWSALMDAAWKGHTEIAKVLIGSGADVNAKTDENGNTALKLAAQEGYTEIVKALIEGGANINAKKNDGATALIMAALWGHTDIASALIKAGADLNAKKMENGWTALMDAAWKGHTDIVSALIKAGADVNAKGKDGWTALMTATYYGHTEIAKALIEAGADVNAKNNKDVTVLMAAAVSKSFDTVKILLENGADPGARDNDGDSAVDYAKSDKIKHLLKAYGAD